MTEFAGGSRLPYLNVYRGTPSVISFPIVRNASEKYYSLTSKITFMSQIF